MPSAKTNLPHNKISPDLEQLIAAAYLLDPSSRRISKHFGVAKGTVLRVVGEKGIKQRPWGLSVEFAQAVVDGLNAGISGPVLAARFGTTPTTIYSHRDKNRLPARRVCDYNYEEDCNHNHFDLIDTPDKAYWLGMLVADGCITNEHEVMLSLHSRDVYLVERFRTTLGSQAKISYQEQVKSINGGKPFTATCAAVRVRSRRLCAALARHSILPGKTRDPRMVIGVPPEFEGDFWRGAVDGDGWLAWGHSAERIQFIVGFTGGMPLVQAFQRFCQRHCPTRAGIHPNHSVFRFVVTDWFAWDIANLMYKDSGLHLPRKYDVFGTAVAHFAKKERQKRNWAPRTQPAIR